MKREKVTWLQSNGNPVDRRQDRACCVSGVMLYRPLEAAVSALTLTVVSHSVALHNAYMHKYT